ncbi:RNA polymerase ADP-ribosylase [Acinetobacter phage vB_AbaM_PhT2]|uniref:RNA polymerase ADP-ribosylase n=1 Tax=Acinetobacter phage vB_AbaM_PhT2 TaxID=2690230 RepID=A0A6B9T0M0_9CAUD|nr:Alt-like RNA polymerase ADP-ribosyltransferase [Acinetobacter phage vB_AbaM_PhT2]QHJ75743.1 RNA polymerase ADP-ribosylase [Acinetobacter phage vB_AbaM_PhT2]
MLDMLTESQLNEAFESEDTYDVIDLMPKAKTPQMFLLKGEGISNLVVRLMGQKENGDTLRNLLPTDKNVVAFIMTLNDKGNLSELKGGLGANPLKSLVSIFDAVYHAINVPMVQTVMFRFPAKKMAGQEKSVRRIMERLIQIRGKSKFSVLSELASYSAKYSYVVAYKKNIELTDIPGGKIDQERFKRVDTKVGEVYVDNETGKETSKAEAVAQAISTAVSKITTQSVITKSKISRREAMAAMYSSTEFSSYKVKGIEKYDSTHSVYAASGKKTKIQSNINKIDLKDIGDVLKGYEHRIWDESIKGRINITPIHDAILPYIRDTFGHTSNSTEGKAMTSNIIRGIGSIIADANPKDLQSMIVKISEFISTTSFGELDKSKRINFTRSVIFALLNGPIGGRIRIAYEDDSAAYDIARQYTDEQLYAIREYTGSEFSDINDYLLGKHDPYPGIENIIDDLDAAFKNGTTLERGTILYRGQSVKFGQMKSIMDTKMLYFKNFVSTSLYPVIYGGFGNATVSIDPGAQDETNLTGSDLAKSSAYHSAYKELIQANTIEDIDAPLTAALIIKGADKINVIVPGEHSFYPDECEVILPRGTILKVNKVVGEVNDNETTYGAVLMETTVVGPEQIDENEDVYDGDLFLTEGKLEKISPSFANFYTNDVELNEAVVPNSAEATEILLSLIDLKGLPDKFLD